MTNNPEVFIKTENGLEKLIEVADVAEVTEGRLQIAYLDGDREMVSGSIFGANGRWKMWFQRDDSVAKFHVEDPMKTPQEYTTFSHKSESELWVPRELHGAIKRLRQPCLPNQ